jgi:probable HAF family extracellular repeat protein
VVILSCGINDGGQIVGSFRDAGHKAHGFLRTAGSTFATIDAPGATETHADGINGTGQIVGLFEDAGGKAHGYVATPIRCARVDTVHQGETPHGAGLDERTMSDDKARLEEAGRSENG